MTSKYFSISAYRCPGSAGRPRQSGQRSQCLIQVPWIPLYRGLQFFIDCRRNVAIIFSGTAMLQFQIWKSILSTTVKHGVFSLFLKDFISYLKNFAMKYCSMYRSTCICESMLPGIKICKIKILQQARKRCPWLPIFIHRCEYWHWHLGRKYLFWVINYSLI